MLARPLLFNKRRAIACRCLNIGEGTKMWLLHCLAAVIVHHRCRLAGASCRLLGALLFVVEPQL